MVKITAVAALAFAAQGVLCGNSNATQNATTNYVDWRTFKATGVNLGGWMVVESGIDAEWWAAVGGNATDEWTLCSNLSPAKCGSILESRYASWYTTADIDSYASAGVSLLRIPTTYAAWIDVPGSMLHRGNQTAYIKALATYAIEKHNMHIVLDLHSLPGGTNGLDIGEASGHYSWFDNATALSHSYAAVDAVVAFIQASGHPGSYTLEPINEPGDNTAAASIGTPAFLSEAGAAYVVAYFRAVVARVRAADPRIPVMLQTSFRAAAYWAQFFDARRDNVVLDVHQYFFASYDSDSDTLASDLCSVLAMVGGDGAFPVYLGEWAIQAVSNNLRANRERNLQAGLFTADRFMQGSAYWSAKYRGNETVDGEGDKSDYWDFATFVELGYVNVTKGAEYCTNSG